MEATNEQIWISKSERTSVNSHAGTGSPKNPSCTSDVPAIHVTKRVFCNSQSTPRVPKQVEKRDRFPARSDLTAANLVGMWPSSSSLFGGENKLIKYRTRINEVRLRPAIVTNASVRVF
jgi:hypothetical protein